MDFNMLTGPLSGDAYYRHGPSFLNEQNSEVLQGRIQEFLKGVAHICELFYEHKSTVM